MLCLPRFLLVLLVPGAPLWTQVGSSLANYGGRLAVTISNDGPAAISSLVVAFRQMNGSGTRALNLTFRDNLYYEGQQTIPANSSQVFSCGGEEGVECEFMGYGALFPDGTTDGDAGLVEFLRQRRRSYVEHLKELLELANEGDPDDLQKLKTTLEAVVEKQQAYDPSLGIKTAPSAAWLGLRDAYQVGIKQIDQQGKRNPEQVITDIREVAKRKIALLTPAIKQKTQ
jgi:hypothetical protein